MLTVSDLTYKIGARTILDDSNITIMDNWKVGVVGKNGAGKTTLFKLISGDLTPDGGTIKKNSNKRLGIVRQDLPEVDTPLIDIVLESNIELTNLWKQTETEKNPEKIAGIYERLQDLDAYSAPSKASRLLTGLGFTENQIKEPFSSFSGGWRMRVALAAALFNEPEILLLDEPTNHLDLEAIIWLESYLANYPYSLLIISHDREILNKCIDHVIHVDGLKLKMYTGNYDTFERLRAENLGLQQKIFKKQQAKRAHMQKFIDRFKAKASKASQAQSRIKALERMDIVDEVISSRATNFNFPNPDESLSPMISINDVDIGYLENDPVLNKINKSINYDDRIALLGANGNGKSTLIKLIANKLIPMNGEIFRSPKLRIGYFSQHQTEELDINSTPYIEMKSLMSNKNSSIKEQIVRSKLGSFGFSHDLSNNKINSLSGGEKARLLFAFMCINSPHLLLLDEPTNHLDIDAREALVLALNNYHGAIIIVSHDPNMVERVADQLWIVKDGKCQNYDGNLDDYKEFTIKSRKEQKKALKKTKNINTNNVSKKIKYLNSQAVLKLEKKIELLENQKKELENLMSTKELYSKNSNDIKQINEKYNKIVSDLEIAENTWFNSKNI